MSDDGSGHENIETNGGPPPNQGGDGRDGGQSTLGVDAALELLRDERRRVVLARLRAREGEEVPLEWLAQQVADARSIVANRPSTRPGQGTQRIAVSLHHVQLPRLADTGVVAYDEDERTCRYLGDDTLEALLDAVRKQEVR